MTVLLVLFCIKHEQVGDSVANHMLSERKQGCFISAYEYAAYQWSITQHFSVLNR